MTDVKWTPGPWTCEEVMPDDKDWGMCEITASDDSWVSTAVLGIANAHLISAAPDMHDALAELISLDPMDRNFVPLWRRSLVAARAALAKARGENS